jgi:hypothetical protein
VLYGGFNWASWKFGNRRQIVAIRYVPRFIFIFIFFLVARDCVIAIEL